MKCYRMRLCTGYVIAQAERGGSVGVAQGALIEALRGMCRAVADQAAQDGGGVQPGAAQQHGAQRDSGQHLGGLPRRLQPHQRLHRRQVLPLLHPLWLVQRRPLPGILAPLPLLGLCVPSLGAAMLPCMSGSQQGRCGVSFTLQRPGT